MAADLTEVKGHVDLMRHARAEKAKWAEVEKHAKAAIEEALDGADEGEIGGQVVVRRNEIKSNKLDQKLLKSLHPDVVAECTGTTVSYRMDLVENN